MTKYIQKINFQTAKEIKLNILISNENEMTNIYRNKTLIFKQQKE